MSTTTPAWHLGSTKRGAPTSARPTRRQDAAARARHRDRLGRGMVTPTAPIVLDEQGERHILQPGASRLAYDHPLVLDRPELFVRDDRAPGLGARPA